MKFPWPRKRSKKCAAPSLEAQRSHDQTIEAISNIDSRWKEVREVTEALRRVRTQNHFAEQVDRIFKPPPTQPRPK